MDSYVGEAINSNTTPSYSADCEKNAHKKLQGH